jgi:hypothetical protein
LRKIIYITLFLSLLLDACSVSKKSRVTNASSAVSNADEKTIESVIVNNLSAENFHIQKADINVTQDNFSARFTASIKFRKPDTMLITVRSRAGIEAGRGLITRDTILINDRINNKLLVGSPTVIGPKYGIEPALFFVLFGDLIVKESDKNRSFNCIKGISKEEFEINGKSVEYIIDCKSLKSTQAYFAGDIKSGNITISFSDIINDSGTRFPRLIEINDDLSSLNIVLEIKKIERPWNGKIGFVPGQGYKVIVLK